MISHSAQSTAKLLCHRNHRSFEFIERRCLSYLHINQSVAGPFDEQGDADAAFLMLVQSEIDSLEDEDRFDREIRAWSHG